jgi:hypothetical protein
MADYKGGRGKRAPYETVMYRIPLPIKPVVELIGHTYRLLVDGVADPNGEQLIRRVEDAVYATGYQPQSDGEDFDPDIDDPSQPTDAEVIKTQVKMIQNLTTEVKVLEREAAEAQERRSQQELEINQLRLQLEQFKALEKNAREQLCECHSDAFKAADVLKAALKLKSNAGGAIKREIEKALPLIDDV